MGGMDDDGCRIRKPNFKFVKGDIKSPDLLQYVIKQEDRSDGRPTEGKIKV